MKLEETKLKGVLKITLDAFEDHRGYYIETYNEDLYKKNGIDVKFVQDDISVSSKNVLRGIHGDQDTWKLISCLEGEFYLVVLNNDENSRQHKQWVSFTLSEKDYNQILVPPKFGNGHLVLSERTIFHYKQSTYYNPDGQFTIRWNDPEYNIWWPSENPIISQRDELGHFVD
jgi:dTDP-4-dehydrorhamnose 3,5-epimerase|tara:strand:+ start:359 stop:874 length:516 start_codon:yes stop_codon:yes gene_type:complete